MEKIEIAKRWYEKSEHYANDENNVIDVMDKFFSLFVAYNALYSKKGQGDKKGAVDVMASYLKNNQIKILNDCEEEIYKMIRPVESGEFHIYGEKGGKNNDNDNDIISCIKEDINNYESILHFIYGIRCNMFHGEKQIICEQTKLLVPANIIMEKLLKALINSYEKKSVNDPI